MVNWCGCGRDQLSQFLRYDTNISRDKLGLRSQFILFCSLTYDAVRKAKTSSECLKQRWVVQLEITFKRTSLIGFSFHDFILPQLELSKFRLRLQRFSRAWGRIISSFCRPLFGSQRPFVRLMRLALQLLSITLAPPLVPHYRLMSSYFASPFLHSSI